MVKKNHQCFNVKRMEFSEGRKTGGVGKNSLESRIVNGDLIYIKQATIKSELNVDVKDQLKAVNVCVNTSANIT